MAVIENIVSALIGGGAFGILNFFNNKRKAKAYESLSFATSQKRMAEAAAIVNDEWMKIVKELQSQIDDLKKEQAEERRQCDSKMKLLKDEIDKLKRQI